MSHLGYTFLTIWAIETRPPLFTFCVLHGLYEIVHHILTRFHQQYYYRSIYIFFLLCCEISFQNICRSFVQDFPCYIEQSQWPLHLHLLNHVKNLCKMLKISYSSTKLQIEPVLRNFKRGRQAMMFFAYHISKVTSRVQVNKQVFQVPSIGNDSQPYMQ